MERKAMQALKEWKASKKALLVTGARQVGKTYIIREFLKNECNNNFIELNLFENELALTALEDSKNAKDLLLRLSAIVNKPLIKGETIIFLDEVQVCKNIITIVKFLVEDGTFKYILSGSLLGTELADIKSIPVGYMQVLNMYPLDFEEFLYANNFNKDAILNVKKCYNNKTKVDEIVHTRLLDLFHLYLIVGGMPAVVVEYLKSNNIKEVIKEQQNINYLYKLDIAKYDKENKLVINDIFESIPSELNNQNKRFIMKNLNEGVRFSKYENSFLWLKNAGVALPAYCADEPKIPLILSKSRNLFKLFHSDVGLLASMYMDGNLPIKLLNKEEDINFGAIYENVVAQELVSKGFSLYYYKNNKMGEIDFLIEHKGVVLPIEVKSGKTYKRHLALDNLLNKENNINEAYILSNNNVEVVNKKVYLPIYMIMFIEKEEIKDMIYKIDVNL